jgi:hypothetical protein
MVTAEAPDNHTRLEPLSQKEQAAWRRGAYLLFAAAAVICVLGAWIPGLIVAGLGIAARVKASSRRATCPQCKNPLSFEGRTITFCLTCRDYRQIRGQFVERIERGYRDTSHVFAVDVPKKSVSQITWPLVCCVCGETATRSQEVEWVKEGLRTAALLVLDKKYELLVEGLPGLFRTSAVPYCSEHEGGVTIYNPNAIGNRDYHVKFRSYSYWQDFRETNKLE